MTSLRRLLNKRLKSFGYEITKDTPRSFVRPETLEKAIGFLERYREIVSDPLNVLIEKVPQAGYVDQNNFVVLHNGNRVPIEGDLAYYKDFSDILVINRGVHEPLEEFCFQETLKKLDSAKPVMLELGSYWAHYSMWLLKFFPDAKCFMVEPDGTNLKCGINNFRINNFEGEFIQSFVGASSFNVDSFVREKSIEYMDVLHSDIQGYEVEMLQGASEFLSKNRAAYVFVSTHGQEIHETVKKMLSDFGYRIEVSSDVDIETTSGDGFVLASSPRVSPVFDQFRPMGRTEIAASSASGLAQFITSTASHIL